MKALNNLKIVVTILFGTLIALPSAINCNTDRANALIVGEVHNLGLVDLACVAPSRGKGKG